MNLVYCWSCGREEKLPPSGEAYIACLECNHLYLTKQELLDHYRKEIEATYDWPMPPVTSVEEIRFCPLCLSDF